MKVAWRGFAAPHQESHADLEMWSVCLASLPNVTTHHFVLKLQPCQETAAVAAIVITNDYRQHTTLMRFPFTYFPRSRLSRAFLSCLFTCWTPGHRPCKLQVKLDVESFTL